MTYNLNAGIGVTIQSVFNEAKEYLTLAKYDTVKFNFNGIDILVNKDSPYDLMYRDYCNAHTMGWESIGPNYVEEYSEETQKELEAKTATEQEKYAKYLQAEKEKDAAKREEVNKAANIVLNFESNQEYIDWKEKNQDPYGRRVFTYAEDWARLMEHELSQGKTLEECANTCSFTADYDGITGFMFGGARQLLIKYWTHGEELGKIVKA